MIARKHNRAADENAAAEANDAGARRWPRRTLLTIVLPHVLSAFAVSERVG
jgi:hypothetical protein